MCIAKGMICNIHKNDYVMCQPLGEMDFGVSLEEICGNCKSHSIGNKCIYFLVKWPINKLVDNKYEMLGVNEMFRELPRKIVIWDVI